MTMGGNNGWGPEQQAKPMMEGCWAKTTNDTTPPKRLFQNKTREISKKRRNLFVVLFQHTSSRVCILITGSHFFLDF